MKEHNISAVVGCRRDRSTLHHENDSSEGHPSFGKKECAERMRAILPEWIRILNQYARNEWISDHLFGIHGSKLWDWPEYTIVHWSRNSSSPRIPITQVYIPCDDRRQFNTKECLLLHQDSHGQHHFRVCKLQQKHLRKIGLESTSRFLESLVSMAISKIPKPTHRSTPGRMQSACDQRKERFQIQLREETAKLFALVGEPMVSFRESSSTAVHWKRDHELETHYRY